jgi:hypothetical protein
MTAPLDLATYCRLTQIFYSAFDFEPAFMEDADESTDIPALAKSLGLRARMYAFEPEAAECYSDGDPITGTPVLARIAQEAQALFYPAHPTAHLVGLWQHEEGHFVALFVDPLPEVGGAA